MSVCIYWSWFFPVYKLSRIQTFLCCIFFVILYYPIKQVLTPFALKHCPQRKPFNTLGNTSPSKALLRLLERCLSIYMVLILSRIQTFPYTNFPVLHFFRHSLLPPKQILTPFALKHCPQRKPFKTLGNTSPIECWRGVFLYILVLILSRIQTFPSITFLIFLVGYVQYITASVYLTLIK